MTIPSEKEYQHLLAKRIALSENLTRSLWKEVPKIMETLADLSVNAEKESIRVKSAKLLERLRKKLDSKN